jgi:hypothetical protein
MKLFQGLLSRNADLDRIEEELARANATGAALTDEIERLSAMEGEIEGAGELMRAMAETQAARNRLRKLGIHIDQLTARRDAAKAPARSALRAELFAEYDKAASEFLAAGRAAQLAFDRTTRARLAFDPAFAGDALALPVPPGINQAPLCAGDLLDIFQADLKRAREGGPPPRSNVDASLWAPRKRALPVHRPNPPIQAPRAGSQAPSPAAGSVRQPLRETANEGEHLVEIVRGGVEHVRTGEQLHHGDIVSVPPKVMRALELNGAAFGIKPEDVAATDIVGNKK